MYDITDQNSFKNLGNWIKQIRANTQPNTCIVLAGNKVDKLDRAVTKEEGARFGKELNMSFFESSAKTNQNVNEVFNCLVEEMLNPGKVKFRKIIGNNLKLDKFLNY